MKNNAKARRLFNMAHWISNTRRVGFREKVGKWIVIRIRGYRSPVNVFGEWITHRGGPAQLHNLPRSPGKSTALAAQGYCRVSNNHLCISRIDRKDWREHLAESHAPWDVAGEGMTWANGDRMGDHYRRCYSKDTLTVTEEVYRTLPASAEGPDEYRSKR